ncbi:hypothetical protein KIPB_009413, partial [Kipferlia bialata]
TPSPKSPEDDMPLRESERQAEAPQTEPQEAEGETTPDVETVQLDAMAVEHEGQDMGMGMGMGMGMDVGVMPVSVESVDMALPGEEEEEESGGMDMGMGMYEGEAEAESDAPPRASPPAPLTLVAPPTPERETERETSPPLDATAPPIPAVSPAVPVLSRVLADTRAMDRDMEAGPSVSPVFQTQRLTANGKTLVTRCVSCFHLERRQGQVMGTCVQWAKTPSMEAPTEMVLPLGSSVLVGVGAVQAVARGEHLSTQRKRLSSLKGTVSVMAIGDKEPERVVFISGAQGERCVVLVFETAREARQFSSVIRV